jgi:hypothetical protein
MVEINGNGRRGRIRALSARRISEGYAFALFARTERYRISLRTERYVKDMHSRCSQIASRAAQADLHESEGQRGEADAEFTRVVLKGVEGSETEQDLRRIEVDPPDSDCERMVHEY